MQLAIDSLDRLVELLEERGGRVRASEAAAHLFAVRQAPEGLARSLLQPARRRRRPARLARGVRLPCLGARPAARRSALRRLRPRDDRALASLLADLRDRRRPGAGARDPRLLPDARRPPDAAASPGRPADRPVRRGATPRARRAARPTPVLEVRGRRRARRPQRALRRRIRQPRARADDRQAAPRHRHRHRSAREEPARRPLAADEPRRARPISSASRSSRATGRSPTRRRPPRCSSASSSWRTSGAPSTLSELEELAAPRPRRIHAKRRLIHGAPTRPGVYLFRGDDDRVLYVGKARDLRARLRSYFRSHRQRPAVETALDQVARIEWRVMGSELAAALEEIALIRRLRPPANARTPAPERYVYLHRRGERAVVSPAPSRYGPLRRRADAQRAAQALRGCSAEEFRELLDGEPPDRLREKVIALIDEGRELDAARLSRRIASLERIVAQLRQVDRRAPPQRLSARAGARARVARGLPRPRRPGDGAA